jgi:hypothetical protein
MDYSVPSSRKSTSAADVSYQTYPSNEQHIRTFLHGHPAVPTYDPPQTAFKHQVVVPQPQEYSNQNRDQIHFQADGSPYESTSHTLVQQKSNPYPQIAQQPQLHDQPALSPPSSSPNQPHHHDVKHDHPMGLQPNVPASAAASVSATLAPMLQDVWTKTQSQVEREIARTHAYYEQVIAQERASAAEQLQKAIARSNGSLNGARRFMTLYQTSQDQNNKLIAEITQLRDESAKLRRKVGKEKGELEKSNRALVKLVQSQTEEMERLKDEWNVGQNVRVKLYAENQKLARELEEVKDKLVKVCRFKTVSLGSSSLSEIMYRRLRILLTRSYERSSRYGLRDVRLSLLYSNHGSYSCSAQFLQMSNAKNDKVHPSNSQ